MVYLFIKTNVVPNILNIILNYFKISDVYLYQYFHNQYYLIYELDYQLAK